MHGTQNKYKLTVEVEHGMQDRSYNTDSLQYAGQKGLKRLDRL